MLKGQSARLGVRGGALSATGRGSLHRLQCSQPRPLPRLLVSLPRRKDQSVPPWCSALRDAGDLSLLSWQQQQSRQRAQQREHQTAARLALLPFATVSAAVGELAESATTEAPKKKKKKKRKKELAEEELIPFETNVVSADAGQARIEADQARSSEKLGAIAKLQAWQDEFEVRVLNKCEVPLMGAARLSYNKFLEMLDAGTLKRLTIYGDGRCALIGMCVPNGGSEWYKQGYMKHDFFGTWAPEIHEWKQPIIHYYLDLPGDFWYRSDLPKVIRDKMPHRFGDRTTHLDWMPQAAQNMIEVVVEPTSGPAEYIAEYTDQIYYMIGLIILRLVLGSFEWLAYAFGVVRKRKPSAREKLMEAMSKNISTAFNIGDGAKTTGVAFDDVQGIDHIKRDVKEILTMLVGNDSYAAMGAKVPRGLLLEGPPGTGKTYLAKAMATESGLPFFAANGAEFVQMFSGVAAARISSLFNDAAKVAPSIIFIDEVDAIGKARSASGNSDLGTKEREQGLMRLLVEMDGFKPADRVLVIAATNRKSVLDPALLRPGRFDRALHMGVPTPENRYKILDVHARGKAIPRGDGDALLRDAASKAIGYSGAELANVLNEAAILQVRYAKDEVDQKILQEVLDKERMGIPAPPIPASAAKRHLAVIWAARAVAAVQTMRPGDVESVTINTVGFNIGRVLFVPRAEPALDMRQAGRAAYYAALLMPKYAARAAEEAVYGRAGTTLGTAPDITDAGQMAKYLVMHCVGNPATLGMLTPLSDMNAVTKYLSMAPYERMVLSLQTQAYQQATLLVHSRLSVIRTIADELCDADATVTGDRLAELLAQPADDVPADVRDALPFDDLLPDEVGDDMYVDEKATLAMVGIAKGDIDAGLFFDAATLQRLDAFYKEQSDAWLEQRQSMQAFALDESAPFPSPPDIDDKLVVTTAERAAR